MKQFLMLLTIALTSFSLLATTAEARRLGGGGSFGKQRSVAPQQTQKTATAPAPSAAPAQPAGNRWLGPLAGLAIGAGLASMFAGGGLGGAMGGILMALLAAGLVMFLIAKFRKPQSAMQYAAASPYGNSQAIPRQLSGSPFGAAPMTSNIPADFPVESFLRSAKTSFIRLQAANDRKDLDDIREYTTPEMFAEVAMQLQERDNTPQKTDVVALNSDLLEVVTEGEYAVASVRFTGQLRENNTLLDNVGEIWHVQKNLRDDKAVWLLSGIQQAS